MKVIRESGQDLEPKDEDDHALFNWASMEGLKMIAGNKKPFEQRMPQLETIAIQSLVETVRGYGQED